MKNDARKYTTEEKHLLRKIAVQRVLNGEVAAEVGRSYGLGARTIYKWLRMAREHGLELKAELAWRLAELGAELGVTVPKPLIKPSRRTEG